ncbi:MAG TPA: roadblock/LC7 domain-containing protein [Chloroflexota bacterium]|nr:roadblock/LC7 domain-containing protein [Chloroflexota bacterium]
MGRPVELREALEPLLKLDAVEGVVLAGTDGLLIEGISGDHADLERLAAAGVFGLDTAAQMTEAGGLGAARMVTIETAAGLVAVRPLTAGTVLVVSFTETLGSTHLRFLLDRLATRVRATLPGSDATT